MMKKFISKTLALIIAMSSVGVSVYAEAPTLTITNDVLTVTGTTTEPVNTDITIVLEKPRMDVSKVVGDEDTGAKAEESIEAIGQILTGAESSYTWTYPLGENVKSGIYTVYAKVYGTDTIDKSTIVYENQRRIDAAFSQYENSTAMGTILNEYSEDLDYQNGYMYNSLDQSKKEFVDTGMTAETLTSAADMKTTFKECMTCIAITSDIKGYEFADVRDMLETSYKKFGITDDEYSAYTNLGEKKEVAITKFISLAGASIPTSDVKYKFSSAVTYADEYNTDVTDGETTTDYPSSYVPPASSSPNKPMPPVSTTDGFVDIQNVSWAADAINTLAKNNVVNGKTATQFYPNDYVKREEFVKMIVLAFELKANEKELTFEDVDKDAWYYDYVKTAVAAGVVNGTSDTTFGTGQYITRQDMAVMLKRAASARNVELLIVDANKKANDEAEISDYALLPVQQLMHACVINGDENGNFNPTDSATRAHAAVMLYNLLYK